MYERLKALVCRVLRVEAKAPTAPAGHHAGEPIRIVRACPAYLQFRLFIWKLYALAWGATVLLACTALTLVHPLLAPLALVLLVVGACKAATLYVTTRLDYEMRWYVITERSLLVREGVWSTREITLTFANAQNVHVRQGPVARWFGFWDVEVDTAGGGGAPAKGEAAVRQHRAILRGVDDARAIRDTILEALRRHRSAGLGDPDDHTGPRARAGGGLDTAVLGEILDEARRLRAVYATSGVATGEASGGQEASLENGAR